jgi:hypothetical protein
MVHFFSGSSLSIRNFARFGSGFSINKCISGGLSTLANVHIGSSLSIRGACRMGCLRLSVASFFALGSSISIRSFGRLASFCSSTNFASYGSSVSIRSFSRFGSTLSVTGALLTNGISLGQCYFSPDTTKMVIKKDSNNILTIEYNSGSLGILHGQWNADSTITSTSDLHLKASVVPLWKELIDNVYAKSSSTNTYISLSDDKARNIAGSKMLVSAENSHMDDINTMSLFQKLTPISYKFKQRVESKYNSFGFIAQEVEKFLPQMVNSPKTGFKSIYITDFISLVTLGLQTSDRLVGIFNNEITDLLASTLSAYDNIEERLSNLEESFVEDFVAKSL